MGTVYFQNTKMLGKVGEEKTEGNARD